MFRLERSFTFEAAHQLPNHDGKCRRLHGHSFRMTLYVEGNHLVKHGPKKDMLIDYGDITRVTKSLLDDYLDHHHLNESTGLTNPTSEALAEWVFNRLSPLIRMAGGELHERVGTGNKHKGPRLVAVRIEETCTAACTYYSTESIEGEETAHYQVPLASPVDQKLTSVSTVKSKRRL